MSVSGTTIPPLTGQTTGASGTSGTSGSSASGGTLASQLGAGDPVSSEDRFLKMLVAQMQNQDPLNPLDNAEVTSQMAQINTVTGLDKVNTSIGSLGTQFMQLQAMQGAALVGHDVAVEGDALRIGAEGQGAGGYELGAAAKDVKVQVTTAAGTVLDTIDLGAQSAGRHTFEWPVPASQASSDLRFKVTATSGSASVDAMTLQLGTIQAVSTFNGTLAIELQNGQRVAYDAVWAFL